MKSNLTLDEQLEQIGAKSTKLIEKHYKQNEPKLFKLLAAFSNWLDKKLSQ